jgi:hypothetical protein
LAPRVFHICRSYEDTLSPLSILYAGMSKCRQLQRRSSPLVGVTRGRVCPEPVDFRPRRTDRKEQPMLDVILLAVGLGFFAIALAYVAGCERL